MPATPEKPKATEDGNAGKAGAGQSNQNQPSQAAGQSQPGQAASGQSGQNQPAQAKSGAQERSGAQAKPGIVEDFKAQHQAIDQVLQKANGRDADPSRLARDIADLWLPHTTLEEVVLQPALADAEVDEAVLDEAGVRRDLVKIVLGDLLYGRSSPAMARAKFTALADLIRALVAIEERPRTGLFALLTSSGIDQDALRDRIEAHRSRAQSATGRDIDSLEPRSLGLTGSAANRQKEEYFPMPNTTRDRDENGRFRSDDDRRGASGRYRDRDENGRFASDDRGSGRRDYDDDNRYRGNDRDRDEYGRFTSDRDDRYARSRRDDDDRYGRSEGHGGWYGDSEGHSEASRRGWANREGAGYSSRSSRDYDDDNRYRGNDRDRDEYGRFTSDHRGQSSRSRRDDDDRYGRSEGHGGWYGDSEGHSEASRRGWANREGTGYSSRSSRDYDDDNRHRGNDRDRDEYGRFTSDHRGQSSRSRDDDDGRGWYGDSRGHSEAARRGWEHRR